MRLTINGRARDIGFLPHETLLGVLRDRADLTGTKAVCERGECGACTVLVDGRLAYSCLTLAAACDGAEITTIEGIAAPGTTHPVQAAFAEFDAAQCGFCTPGQVIAAIRLLEANPNPSDDDIRSAMSGNLCRCGTYPKIMRAIRAVAERGAMHPEAPHGA